MIVLAAALTTQCECDYVFKTERIVNSGEVQREQARRGAAANQILPVHRIFTSIGVYPRLAAAKPGKSLTFAALAGLGEFV